MKDIIIDWFTSWQSQLLLLLATVAFLAYYIWVEWRPAAMVKFFNGIVKALRNALKSNKTLMCWLYGEKTEATSMPVKIHKHWRSGRW